MGQSIFFEKIFLIK